MNQTRTCLLLLFLLWVWLLATPCGWAQSDSDLEGVPSSEGQESIISRGPYLQLATPESIWVVWRTDHAIAPVLRFGKTPEALDREISGEAIIRRVSLSTNKNEKVAKWAALRTEENLTLPQLHSAHIGTFQYEAKITGLTSDSRYHYAVYDGDERLTPTNNTYHFTTHPPKGAAKPARVWIVGDSGTGRETQSTVHHGMLSVTLQERKPIDFYLHVGDMAYLKGRDVEFQSRFFEIYDSTLRNTVCWPSMGNHEGATSKGSSGTGPYYDAYILPTRGEAGGVASGMEAYYSFDYGRIHFICLDSHDLDRKPTGTMARWLETDLQKTKADWVLAYFHHPPYTKGSHDSDREKQLIEMRTHIMPILESGGVDLVLTGHSHIYERSMLMDGAYATPTIAENVILDDGDGDPRPKGDGPYRKSAGIHPNEGAVQIVAGHGGTTLGRKGTMPVMKQIIVEHGSVILDIVGDTLTGIMIDKYGVKRDTFGMVKRGTVTPVRLANPWQPEPWKKPTGPDGKDLPAEPPEDFFVAIAKNAQWHYLAGEHPEGDGWMKVGFDATDWEIGEAGFGYNNNEVRTVLSDMKDAYSVVYVRHEFEVEQADYVAELGLMINYDDAFIAYLNGKEVLRKGVEDSGKKAKKIKPHDAGRFSYYPLKEFEKHLKTGKNVLAIEGHNAILESSDFVLDPYLIIED